MSVSQEKGESVSLGSHELLYSIHPVFRFNSRSLSYFSETASASNPFSFCPLILILIILHPFSPVFCLILFWPLTLFCPPLRRVAVDTSYWEEEISNELKYPGGSCDGAKRNLNKLTEHPASLIVLTQMRISPGFPTSSFQKLLINFFLGKEACFRLGGGGRAMAMAGVESTFN